MADNDAENQTPVEIEVEKTNDGGQKLPRKPPTLCFWFLRAQRDGDVHFQLANLTATAAFCRVGSAQGVSGDGRVFLQWLKAAELFTGSHKRPRDDQIFCS